MLVTLSMSRSQSPLGRIREAIRQLPEAGGMRRHGTAGGFAKWIGRSASLIRNVENGCAPLSANLARRIEERTGVAADWLLKQAGAPVPELLAALPPIIARDGTVGAAAHWLSPLVAGGIDFGYAAVHHAEHTAALAAALLEAVCLGELEAGGRSDTLTAMLALLKGVGSLDDPALDTRVRTLLAAPRNDMVRKLWYLLRLTVAGAADKAQTDGADAGGPAE